MGEKIQGDYLYVLVHKFDEFCGVYKKLLFILLSMVMNIVQGTYSNNVILMLKSTIDKRYSIEYGEGSRLGCFGMQSKIGATAINSFVIPSNLQVS